MGCKCKSKRKFKANHIGLKVIANDSKCKHFVPVMTSIGSCLKGHGKPAVKGSSNVVSSRYCETCPDYEGPIRGLGDVAHKLIHILTFGRKKPCVACLQRRARWNKGFKKWQ